MKHYSNNKTRKIKAFFSVILSVVMLLSLSSVCFAAYPGDVDNDGQVSASDSRLAFRASVGLEDLSAEQKAAADVIKESATATIINVMDAREILRIATDFANVEVKQVTFTDITDSYNGGIKLLCSENENRISVGFIADKVTQLNAFDLKLRFDSSKLELAELDIKNSDMTPWAYSGKYSVSHNLTNDGEFAISGYFQQSFDYTTDYSDDFKDAYELTDEKVLFYVIFVAEANDITECDFSLEGKMYVNETSFVTVDTDCTYVPEETTQPEAPTVHEHSYSREVIIEPGCVTIGEQEFTCSCGEIYRGIIPATGHTDNDADGICDACDKDITEKDNSSDNTSVDSSDFLAKILSILKKIAEFFRKLFNM